MKDSEKAYSSVKQLLGKLSRENMFTVSPAGIAGAGEDIFAFDGNTAGAAGMAEMLLQSHDNCTNYCLVCRKNGKTEVSKDFVRVEVSNRRKLEKRPDRKYGIQGYRATEFILRLPNAEHIVGN